MCVLLGNKKVRKNKGSVGNLAMKKIAKKKL